jgi:hypothetical protein
MSHWPFILAAYGATIAATLATFVSSYAAMRRAEAEAEGLRSER